MRNFSLLAYFSPVPSDPRGTLRDPTWIPVAVEGARPPCRAHCPAACSMTLRRRTTTSCCWTISRSWSPRACSKSDQARAAPSTPSPPSARTHPSSARRLSAMCRNIRQLHNFEPPATHDEVHDAALQYVRKISGSTKPSQANAAALEVAVEEVAAATRRLFEQLVTNAPPKNRDEEAAKARARAQSRYAA